MKLSTIISLLLALTAPSADAQGLTDSQIQALFDRAEPCVVHLSVSGTHLGQDMPIRNGTGVIIKTTSGARILTAKHVVGLDTEYDPEAGAEVTLRMRDINMTVRGSYGPSRVGPLHAALTSDQYDVAQVYLDAASNSCLLLSKQQPVSGQSLLVVSWPTSQSRSQPTAVRVLPTQADDGDLIRVDHEFFEGESGAPVLDSGGFVAGLLVVRDQPGGASAFTYVLPVASFRAFVTDAVFGDDPRGPATHIASWVDASPVNALPPQPLHCACLAGEVRAVDIWEPLLPGANRVFSRPNSAFRFTNRCTSDVQLLAIKETLLGTQNPCAAPPPGFQPISPIAAAPGREFALETLAHGESVIFDMRGATGGGIISLMCPVG